MTYTIAEDILFINFIRSKPNLSEKSKTQYRLTLGKFCEATNSTLKDIIDNCKSQQNRVIEKIIKTTINGNEEITEKEIIEFDVNNPDSYIQLYLNTHLNYCKSRNNTNITLNHDFHLITSFLRYYNIKLPKLEKFKDDSKEWFLLEKEDIQYIISDSSISHSSLITFLIETGVRIGDATRFTIGDFMEATKEYHNCIDVNDFVDNAPDDMIGVWEFKPQKTQRFGLKCITCNGPSSTKRILQNLRRIKNEYFPYVQKKYGKELTLSKDDALFGSKNSNFKGPIKTKSLSDIFSRKNKKFQEWRISKIDKAISEGELSADDREKEIAKIPRFHAHACRKYFETIISRNCGDLRLCALMEGHTSPLRTDSSYIKKEADEVKEVYLVALPDLSVDNTETKVYTSEIRKEMESKIADLENQNKELESKVQNKEDAMGNMEERLSKVEKIFSNVDELSDDEILSLFARKRG